MIPRRYNTESTHKTQNFSSGPKMPELPVLRKLNLNWDRRLEKLLNNRDAQDDYFQIYSDASNTTISTICINSNRSGFTDSCWSDTDDTRRDDIVIRLSEHAFYNTKVNPFPQLNFPPTIKSEKKLSKIIEDVAPAGGVAEAVIDIRINEDVNLIGVASEADTFSPTVIPDNGFIDEETDLQNNQKLPPAEACSTSKEAVDGNNEDTDVSPEVKDNQSNSCCAINDLVNQNNGFVTADDVVIEVKDDQSNKTMACDVNCDLANGQNSSEIVLPAAHGNANVHTVTLEDEFINEATDEPKNEDMVAPSEVTDSQNITENLINTSNEKKNGCDNEDPVRAIDDVTNSTAEEQNKGVMAVENIDNNDIIEDKSQTPCSIPVDNSTQIQVNSTENAMEEKIAVPQLVSKSSIESSKSIRNLNNNIDEVKRTNSNPEPVSSQTSSKNNSGLEMRKKRYRKTVDANHRKNVQSQLSKSSGCTKVTSTTTVQVTTNDDTVFDALADMPEFINSSVINLASSYIESRMRQEKNQRTRFIDFDSALPSSSSSFTQSWRNEKLSSIDDEYISPREAYKQLNNLLKDGTNENLKAVMYDDYNGFRFDDDVASSEDEFLSDIEDLNLTKANWTPPESELRRQVAIILKKIHPLENNYSSIIDDMLVKYLNYIHSKQKVAKVNRIVDCVNKPVSQQEKTEMLIRREINDKKLNREFYHSPMEPSDFTELCERRREAIIRKYTRCHNDRKFCYSYFMRSIDDRPVSNVGRKIAKLKQELELIFA
ncbi:uncharacterized protein LOC119073410 isoform X2 [Bradysia coprophila]|uniref:uncharacterized protein LOC119073410 isoform X2 n=1 Tax=Bradysia coprophila TaxID=38358 RepID=UPI00187D82BB|nr:uncharacterized protein LOC119073410 isoform X2 [Bradysia coprophila]